MTKYHIAGTKKRTGEFIEGTTTWDGLSSLYTVETTDGVKYMSVLDNITTFDALS